MQEYWEKVHDEALAGMRRVTGQEVAVKSSAE